jgi:hypothetical protein
MSEQGVSYTSCFFVTLDILIYWDNFLLILRSVVLPKGHRDDVSEARNLYDYLRDPSLRSGNHLR